MKNNIIKQNNNLYNKCFFTIEGNIGAGKTTFLKKLSQSLNCDVLFEPCEKWQDINGYNALEKFYTNIQRWAYSFQLYAFLTRTESILQKLEKPPHNHNDTFFLAERSIFADRYVFAKACHQGGFMENLEWNMYTTWFDWTLARQPEEIIPKGIIYLQTDPHVSYRRILHRGRSEEKDISLEYIKKLYTNHHEWLILKENIELRIKDIPILILDCNEEFENNSIIWENMVYLVKSFMTKTLL